MHSAADTKVNLHGKNKSLIYFLGDCTFSSKQNLAPMLFQFSCTRFSAEDGLVSVRLHKNSCWHESVFLYLFSYVICSDNLAERFRVEMKGLTLGDAQRVQTETENGSITLIKDHERINQKEEICKISEVDLQEEVHHAVTVKPKKIDRTAVTKMELIGSTWFLPGC